MLLLNYAHCSVTPFSDFIPKYRCALGTGRTHSDMEFAGSLDVRHQLIQAAVTTLPDGGQSLPVQRCQTFSTNSRQQHVKSSPMFQGGRQQVIQEIA